MAEDSRDKNEGRVRVDQMPPAVKKLVDAMLGIDPNFKLEDWLVEKANQELKILKLDLERERIQLSQRLHRPLLQHHLLLQLFYQLIQKYELLN